jgi:hypothetical protein
MLNDYKMGATNLLTRYKKFDTTAMMVLQKSPRGTYYWCEKDKVEKTPRKTSCTTRNLLIHDGKFLSRITKKPSVSMIHDGFRYRRGLSVID